MKGAQRIADIGGLTTTHPLLGWVLVAAVAAIAGLPPFGVFTSEFLVISSIFAREPTLALLFVFGLLVSIGALFLRLNSVAFGEVTRPDRAGHCVLCADVRASCTGTDRRHLAPRAAGDLVPTCGGVVGMIIDTTYWQEAAAALFRGRSDAPQHLGRTGQRSYGRAA